MKIISLRKKNNWDDILRNDFGCYDDVFLKYNYFYLFAKHYGVEQEALFGEDENAKTFWPHLIKQVNNNSPYFQLVTPFIYAGPLVIIKNKKKSEESLTKFLSEYNKYAIKKNYISEHIKFHPLFQTSSLFPNVFRTQHHTDHIFIDLTKNTESIWENMRQSHRRYIRKALRCNCSVKITASPSKKDISLFIALYHNTLMSAKAMPKFYFSPEFINDLFKLTDAILVSIIYNGNTVASGVFLLGKMSSYYHLGGSLKSEKPHFSKLMIWESIKYLKDKKLKYLFLGGGRGKNDSLFHYKKGFSNLSLPQKNATIIFNKKIHKNLFPSYAYPPFESGKDFRENII